EVNVRRFKTLEIAGPAFPLANVLDDVLQRLAFALRNQSQGRPTIGLQGGTDRNERLLLFRHPVEGVEGNKQVKLVSIGQTPHISNLEAQVRPGVEMASCKPDHVS